MSFGFGVMGGDGDVDVGWIRQGSSVKCQVFDGRRVRR